MDPERPSITGKCWNCGKPHKLSHWQASAVIKYGSDPNKYMCGRCIGNALDIGPSLDQSKYMSILHSTLGFESLDRHPNMLVRLTLN